MKARTARTKFLKMYNKLPKKARTELIYNAYGKNPMSISVLWLEIRYESKLHKKLLKGLGYEDDEENK